jgi:hypothetical protein
MWVARELAVLGASRLCVGGSRMAAALDQQPNALTVWTWSGLEPGRQYTVLGSTGDMARETQRSHPAAREWGVPRGDVRQLLEIGQDRRRQRLGDGSGV